MMKFFTLAGFCVSTIIASVMVLISYENSEAFDCAKASTPTEEAICTRANLKTQDDAMSRIYYELRGKFSKPARKQLLDAQKTWLAYRAHTCGGDSDCLLDETQLWTIVINTLPREMVPVFIWQKGNSTQYNIRLSGVRFAAPKNATQKLFNAELDKLLADVPFNEVLSPGLAYIPSHEINWEISRYNENLLSGTISSANYSGAHPVFYQDTININVKSGNLLETKNLFSKQAIDELTTSCRDQVIAVKYESSTDSIEEKRQQIEESYPGVVREHVLSMKEWNFGETKGEEVEIYFDKYQIGAGAEIPYQCYFSNVVIREKSEKPELFQ